MAIELRPIGHVESSLTDPSSAPRQPDEGAPSASLVLEPEYVAALAGIEAGQRLVVLTWLDRADRGVLRTHPRGDTSRPPAGVFATRSPDRPNPIGLHAVHVVAVAGNTIRVAHLEALDGTPVLDLKPDLGPVDLR
ncbi:MAG TPA: tRNA (N6-threonylcarbamoyladenosine(37)-N6)-methyltransferase TrmO [Marmoricola sp.]|jgi:tRNA-Thr(GGU) m(6)t(6)A37 methyltransferase TsaA|nr:tRNA (N6-threonylcarbamoyladenosine(37)-N6)-methyltransferase TrmO [Marmoricola sp.]